MPTLTRNEITRMTPPERLSLIGDLWDSMTDADTPLSSAQRRELVDRMASFEQDRQEGVTWEQFKFELATRAP